MRKAIQNMALMALLLGALLHMSLAQTQFASILTCDPSHCSSCENCPGATTIGLYTNMPMAICPEPGTFCIIAQLNQDKRTVIHNCAACATTYAGSCTDCVLKEDNLGLNFCGPHFCWSLGFSLSQTQPYTAATGATTTTQTNTTTNTTTVNTTTTNTTTTNTTTTTNITTVVNTTAPANYTTVDACGNQINVGDPVTTTNVTSNVTTTTNSTTTTTTTNTSETNTTTQTNTSTTTTGGDVGTGSGNGNSPGQSSTGTVTFPVLSGMYLQVGLATVLTVIGSTALLV